MTPAVKPLDIPAPRRPAECPVEDWLAFLGHRWNALALWHLSTGPKRFGELAALLPGITAKTLTERLEGLAARGLVVRAESATFPRRTLYRLTPDGEGIVAILDRIEVWAAGLSEG